MTPKPNTMPDGALTAADRAAITRRYFTVMEEEQLFADLHMAHALRVGPALCAWFNRTDRRKRYVEPVMLVPEKPAPETTVIAPVQTAPPQDLRALLGLR